MKGGNLLHKKTKIFITLFCIFIFTLFFQTTSAKYVIDKTIIVANIDIDGGKPIIELLDIISSNPDSPIRASQYHTLTGHLKITERNITRNDLSFDTIKIAVGNRYIMSEEFIVEAKFTNLTLMSENAFEKIYEFSFTSTPGSSALGIIIPEGIVEDKYRIYQ